MSWYNLLMNELTKQAGYTLLEVLVGVGVFLVLIAAAVAIAS